LYGEFSDGTSRVAIGDREHFKAPRPSPLPPKEASSEKDAAFDLFSVQKDVLSEPGFSSRQVSPEQKPDDHASRYVPLHDFEKKSISSATASSSSDSHARFRYNRPQENKWALFLDFLKGFSEKTGEMFQFLLDPKQVALRRVFYWGVAVLVVFFLFWGVNALNSQREEAMRARYKIPGEPAPARIPEVVPAVVPPQVVAERPVVITPAPVRPKKVPAPEGSAVTAAPVSASYFIQVATYAVKQDADQIVNSFRRAGLRAFVKEGTRSSGRLYYLVLLGGFRTEAEAQAQLLKFRAKEVARPFQDAFVKSSRS
ncbi:MAG: SPOR domain-containing protein, partial [Candidatus Omnitrophica bacterium]|nr:SPOR domain-containing protein [Candidatus Omnitrophota bacterium]